MNEQMTEAERDAAFNAWVAEMAAEAAADDEAERMATERMMAEFAAVAP